MKVYRLLSFTLLFLALCGCRNGEQKVMARFVPERADDFIFENDLICGRIYGQALEGETISPGIDVWVKKAGPLVADRRYVDDLQNNRSYHKDWGDGKDCYKVGRSLGAGASAPIVDGVLYLPQTNYRSYSIDSTSPDEVVFTLHYPEWNVCGVGVTLDKTVTVKAGSYFCSVRDVYVFSDPDASLAIACGVLRHKEDNRIEQEKLTDNSYAIWEHASDQSQEPEDGMLGIGVRMADAEWTGYTTDETHGVCVKTVRSGEPVLYEFASCWSKAEIKEAQEWFSLFDGCENKNDYICSMEKTITDQNFAQIIKESDVVLVDFWAPWCGPCRALAPTIAAIAEEYAGKVTVAKCNVDDCEDVAAEYGIRSIPTLIYFKGGEAVQRSVGALPGSQIKEILDSLI